MYCMFERHFDLPARDGSDPFHSSGIPALRRPTRYVVSYRAAMRADTVPINISWTNRRAMGSIALGHVLRVANPVIGQIRVRRRPYRLNGITTHRP